MRDALIWITGIIGALLMWATQVGPKQAVSHAGEWAQTFGWKNPPSWLRDKETDRIIRHIAGLLLLLWFVATLFAYVDPIQMSRGPQILLLISVAGAAGALVWNFASPGEQRQLAPIPASLRSLLTWEQLSASHVDLLKQKIAAAPTKGTAVITCVTPYCNPLGSQLIALFEGEGWRARGRIDRLVPPPTGSFGGSTTGLSIGATAVVSGLKDALSSAIQASLGIEAEQAQPQGQTDQSQPTIVVMIRARQLPDALPDAVKQELTVLGKALIDLSGQISVFIGDRDREQARIVSVGDLRSDHEARTRFMNETTSLFSQRFGARLAPLLFELSALGIVRSFWVQDSQPKSFERFTVVMGEFVQQARIKDAIANSLDNIFWFHQSAG